MTIKVIQADREAVARIIDPDAETGRHGLRAATLAKADAILASHADPLRRALERIAGPLGVEPSVGDRGYTDAKLASHWRAIAIAYRREAVDALSSGENNNGE